MGHTRLGPIPKSYKWDCVVETVLESAGAGELASTVPAIAAITADAARVGLRRSASDPGLVYSFYLLALLGLAGRGGQTELPADALRPSEQDSVYDMLAQFQLAVDEYVAQHGGPSDYSEMAQQAAGNALLKALEPQATSLFGSGRDELGTALRTISTGSGFSGLAQDFFGDYLARFLNFYLSRVTARTSGYAEFRQLTEFNEQLRIYSHQTARIVSDFASSWLSKTAYLEGISAENTRAFMFVAAKKLASELAAAMAADDGEA